MPFRFDLPKCGKDRRGAKGCDGEMTKGGEKVLLHPGQDLGGVPFAPGLYLLGVPISGHDFEGIRVFGSLRLGSSLFILPCFAWVYAVCDELAGFVAALPGILEGDIRIGAQRNEPLPTGYPVAQPPPLAALGANFQMKAALILEADGFGTRLGVPTATSVKAMRITSGCRRGGRSPSDIRPP